mgnify:CR=1 FL=1
MKYKRWTRLAAAVIMILVLSAAPLAAASANTQVTVLLNGQKLLTDSPAVLKNGTTYVPLRAFAEAFSQAEVTWNDSTRTAIVRAPGLNIEVRAGRKYMVANDRYFYMSNSILIQGGRVLVPVRALSAAYGVNVEWIASTRTVSLTGSGSPALNGAQYYDADSVLWLARIIHAESQGEPLDGKIAVGNVILNRVRSRDFPNTIYSVIFDKNNGVQFTPAANGSVYNTPGAESVIAAKLCLDGAEVVPRNCLYFLNAAAASNFWVPQNRPYLTTIGNHQFYG